MLRSLKWYWKLLIILGIMVVFYAFTNKGFIVNVQAKTKWNREVLFYNENGVQVSPTLNNSSKLYSNYLTINTLDGLNNGYKYYYNQFYKTIDYSTGEVMSNSQGSGTCYSLTGNKTLNHATSGNGNFIHKISMNTCSYNNGIVSIAKGHTYTILFEFSRDNNSFYRRGSDYTLEDFEYGGRLRYRSSNYDYFLEMSNYLTFESIDFITPSLGDDDTPYAFLKIVFTPNDNLGSNTTYYIEDLYVGLKNDNSSLGDFVNISGGYNFFLANTSDTNSVYTFSRIFYIEDLEVAIGNIDYTGASGSSLSSTIYEQCDNLDLQCHIRNLTRGVESLTKNLIHSIRQLFSYLFIPNPQDVSLMFSDFRTALLEKLGFLGYFIDLFEDFIYEISTITIDNDPVITLPELKEPFTNTTIWSGGNYYIKYYMTYGALGTLYNIYYLFISAYLIFLFINFCVDSIDDIFVGRVGGNLTGNMLEEINDSDYTPRHEYTGRHSEAHTSLYRHLRDRR